VVPCDEGDEECVEESCALALGRNDFFDSDVATAALPLGGGAIRIASEVNVLGHSTGS